jgi:hypothetical protein
MFEVNKPFKEGPLLGAVVGGMMGYGGIIGTGAGLLGGGALGAIAGAALGGVSGKLMGDMMKGPEMPNQNIADQTPTNVPSTPAAPVAPAVPDTPGADPGAVPTEGFTPGEASPQTGAEVSQGELNRKRRGRVSTILTNREATVGEEEVERLGG